MTVSSGSSADRARRGLSALGVVAVLFAASACSGSSGAKSGGATPGSRPDEALRGAIRAGLAQSGRNTEADIVVRGGSRLTRVQAPFLKRWQIIRVDYRQTSRPVLFHVAVGEGQARLLTGAPAAFGEVTAADGVRVTDPAVAAQLARTFVETTRPAGRLTYVVGAVTDIRFRPGLTGAAAARRDQIVKEYGSVLAAPAAKASGEGFAAIVYVVQGRALQRRDITVGAGGSVRERTRVLAPDLPVPIAL